MSDFHFLAATEEAERQIVSALGLAVSPLDPGLAHAEGAWKGQPVTIETRAYRGGQIRFARFARLWGAGLEIGNLLCLPDAEHPLPILGADLVALGRESGMLAVDLSPTLPPGPERDAQLAPLAARRAAHPALPSGGELPAWCADWFSPQALYTRVGVERAGEALDAFRDFPSVFIELARTVAPRPDLADHVSTTQAGYAAAHRTDDKGLGLLARMFGPSWAQRYLDEVLFP